MTDKKRLNGKSGDYQQADNVTRLPNLKERDKMRRQAEKELKKQNHEPIFNIPTAVKWLMFANIAIFLCQYITQITISEQVANKLFFPFGFIPARFSGFEAFTWQAALSPFTYMFLHGGWFHLIINMTFLMGMGSGIERFLGAKRTIVFFIACGLFACLFHFIVYYDSMTVMVGASGGVSGVFGAVMVLMYKRNGLSPKAKKMMIPVVILFIIIMVIFGTLNPPGTAGENIAWTAHIGGFLAGLALMPLFLKPQDTYKL